MSVILFLSILITFAFCLLPFAFCLLPDLKPEVSFSSKPYLLSIIDDLMERSKWVAIITGAISVILAIAYLLLVAFLDSRGEMIPAPVGLLINF